MPLLEQPVLLTTRLALREVRADDADGLYAVHSDVQVMRYWGYPAWIDIAQAHAKVADIARQRANEPILVWAVADRDSDALIGSIALFNLNQAQGRAEIGYSLASAWQGRGLAREALLAVLGHAFEGMGLRRIEADVDPRNRASCRLAEGLGFRAEGLLRERWQVNGELCDSVLYGLLRAQLCATGATAPVSAR